jgi:GDPmannose 4,6-dehydratase
LYNHESERRPSSFVTTQIAQAAAKAYLGEPVKLILNDLDAKVDWGSAQDYVQAMWLTLQQVHSDDYIIATGIPHSVRDFSNVAFNHVGLNSKDFVFQKALLKENTGSYYLGDSSKIKKLCNWNTTKTFIEIVNSMVDYQVLQLKNSSKKF